MQEFVLGLMVGGMSVGVAVLLKEYNRRQKEKKMEASYG
jgi:hypothetical protein